MSADQFLHCLDCGVVFRPTPYDRAPAWEATTSGWQEVPRDDCMEFLTVHARHHLRTLRPTGSAMLHEGPLWDPMVATYWEVSDGAETVVVQGSREHVDQPLCYRIIPGRLVAERLAVEIPEDDLRQQIDRALWPGTCPERKLAAFVECCKQVVWDVDPATLQVIYDVPSDPSLSVARLPAAAVARLAEHARRIFDTTEAARLETLLGPADDGSDLLTVLIRQRVRVAA
jgi:hypothetical protein